MRTRLRAAITRRPIQRLLFTLSMHWEAQPVEILSIDTFIVVVLTETFYDLSQSNLDLLTACDVGTHLFTILSSSSLRLGNIKNKNLSHVPHQPFCSQRICSFSRTSL